MTSRWPVLALFGLAAILLIAGCGPRGGPGEQEPRPEYSQYEKRIERPLFDLTVAEDPKTVADEHDLDYYPMVRVVIELAPEAPLPEGYLIVEETRSGNNVQALVRLDQLLELAEQPGIEYIRKPAKPIAH